MTENSSAENSYEAASRIYGLMRHLVLEADDRRAEVAQALGMSFIRAKALRHLAAAEEPLRMSELTAVLATDKPYTTLIVDDLEKRGLAVRTVHPDDRRCKIVSITPDGRELASRADAILARPPAALAAMDEDELTYLERLLARL